ncbi:hypothetical protein [Aquimarina rubra]|uniref:Uncharacterized protein n=1 Tax=Aquimarina rubra TaxID=1920033 RepID=A0ABW5LJ34_9FLAO
MAISKKGKRKITVNSENYLWWIFTEFDQTEFDGVQIKIVAENQSGYLKYGLEQIDKKRYISIGLNQNKYKVHILCPKFENDDGIITPSGIETLIKWSLSVSEIKSKENQITHGYSMQIGLIDKNEYLKTYEKILNGFISL